MKKHSLQSFLTAFTALFCILSATAQVVDIMPEKTLLDAKFGSQDLLMFKNPPKEFWPETWFHFIGDNVSSEGIDADLEAISNAGIGGIQWFHGSFGGRWPNVDTPVIPLSKDWDNMVNHLARKARSLDLRLTIQTCPGWAMAGGPWVKPEDAMRTLIWSRTDIKAGEGTGITLPKGSPSDEEWRDYRDICVLAFPTPEGADDTPLLLEDVSSDEPEWVELLQGKNEKSLRAKANTTHKVRFRLPKGGVVRTLQLPTIKSLNDGWVYKPDVTIRLDAIGTKGNRKTVLHTQLPMASWQDDAPLDLAVEETDATEMELTITNQHSLSLSYLRFISAAHKNDWQAEAGRTLHAKELFQEHTQQSKKAFVDQRQVRDITAFVDRQGRLNWTAPKTSSGWTILRFGHVNSGRRNGPAPAEATGWECNKFDKHGAEVQFSNYVGRLQQGPLEGLANGMLMDSWECNNQTWTGNMEDEFGSRSGYGLRMWMPALAGYVVGSQETTNRFLIDWRRCTTSLYNENFFQHMTDLAHGPGLKVQYETAGGDVVAMDPLEFFKYADVPMCEFWHPIADSSVGCLNFKPIKPTASAAHIYGKRRVAAESFTSFDLNWDEHWEMLKEVANLNMTEGVTHNVFHTYTHNPQVGFLPPGTSFGSGIGTPFLRGQTWWKYMPVLTRYLARTSYLLERGLPVVDVLWYLGDEVGHRPDQLADFPEGFKYDYCNPDVLLNRLSVADGKLVTPDGQHYEVLWIPQNERMLPETLEKLYQLIQDGAKVVAEKPVSVATLKDGKKAEKQFNRLVKAIWTKKGEITAINNGKMAYGVSLEEALKAFGLKPHLTADNGRVQWTKRQVDGAEWYYVTAPAGGEFHGTLRFKSKGDAELWNTVTGEAAGLPTTSEGEYRVVRLDLEKAENCFIVFKPQGALKPQQKPQRKGVSVALTDWTLTFPEGWGTPAEPVELHELLPWKDLDIGEEGKAFSGTATYETTVNVSDEMAKADVVLDLGRADMIADVKINGKPAGILWARPYRLDIGNLLKTGKNTVTIDITSTWFNRLAYDANLPEAERKTWTIAGPKPQSPLRESGLMGPVVMEY